MKPWRLLAVCLLAALLVSALCLTAYAERAEFTYQLMLTDQNGREVYDPRQLHAGDTLNVEIELTREDVDTPYSTYGLEFRLFSRGIEFNKDGASFRSGTNITKQIFLRGDSVGFAYYDNDRVGEQINNPVLAGQWSYTVKDPSAIQITVPVALMYVTNDEEAYEPVGNARLFLDPGGGKLIGLDVSGDYRSGSVVTLPRAEFGERVFKGWTDGVQLYAAGSSYTVTGVVTLTAVWADFVRNRDVQFNPNGGTILGDDPGGLYGDGEELVLPNAERPGYVLLGWEMDGRLYAPGEVYVVDNSAVFIAQWEKLPPETEQGGESALPTQTEPESGTGAQDDRGMTAVKWAALALVLLAMGFWLFLLLWRCYVRYSLLDGGVRLSYRDRERDSRVQVWLTDKHDDKEYLLTESDTVPAGEKLKRINGTYVIRTLKRGFYDGRLHVTYPDGTDPRDVKVRIHAKKKEYNEYDRNDPTPAEKPDEE